MATSRMCVFEFSFEIVKKSFLNRKEKLTVGRRRDL